MHGRYVDTVTIGQNNPASDIEPGTYDLPDRLILSIGRPVITIPYVINYPEIGKRVLVSRDASRLATRVVNEALKLLQLADQVDVLAINPAGGSEGHGDIPAADICQHLARHDVSAEAKSITTLDMNVGDTLLSRAANFSSDLIVMGGYGHRRLRELVLDGVTRHLLKHMTAPVMMSHYINTRIYSFRTCTNCEPPIFRRPSVPMRPADHHPGN
ncbi:MAG: universal stress protein [Rhodospirillales bacterium]|nr:universal stress protein [Rhodospirillales bacterium]